MEKKIERLMSIDFDSKPTYGDGDKYINNNINIWRCKKGCKKYQKKKYHANVNQ